MTQLKNLKRVCGFLLLLLFFNTTTLLASSYKSISSSSTHTMAIGIDGTLWAWGNNANGQLGNGTTSKAESPVKIGIDTNWKMVSCGDGFTIAIKTNGTLWSWGKNNNGQLGNGSSTTYSSPRQVGTDTNWKKIDTDTEGNSAIALKTDNTLWSWGYGAYNQLGQSNNSNILSPTRIGTATTLWKDVSMGSSHTLAIKSDGTLWAWGLNTYGQLGDNTLTNKLLPTAVLTSGSWISISAGGGFSTAIKSDGTLWAWGKNNIYQLGMNVTGTRKTPRNIRSTITDWISVSSGNEHSIAKRRDGSIWSWGSNYEGQL
jgi:alpha-tubulin suppressor-like RCC1 family protein